MGSTGAIISEESIAELRKRIGKERVGEHPYNEEATKDAIRHYTEGIGDNNPLWLDEEYAKKTRYGGIIAPPLFVETMGGDNLKHGFQQGLPGAHCLDLEKDWHFFSPVRLGDRMISRGRLIDVQEKPHTRISDRMAVLQRYQTDYINSQTNKLAATYVETMLRFERGASQKKGKYSVGSSLLH